MLADWPTISFKAQKIWYYSWTDGVPKACWMKNKEVWVAIAQSEMGWELGDEVTEVTGTRHSSTVISKRKIMWATCVNFNF